MNPKILSVFGILLLIISSFLIFNFFGVNPLALFKPKPKLQGGKTSQGTVLSLVKKGGNNICEWTSDTDGVATSGKAYLSGEKFAADLEISSYGFTVTGNVIRDKNIFYFWSPALKNKGIKTNFSELESKSKSDETVKKLINTKINYVCTPQETPSSKFLIPDNINFQSI